MNRNAISALLTSLPLEFEPAVREAASLGFQHIDVVALEERPSFHVEALADAGITVSCCSIGRDLPAQHTLDGPNLADRRAALDSMKRQVADAARLGATHAYVVSGTDASPEGLARYAEGCTLLADFAAGRMVKLCVEHIPGRALSTAIDTLLWLDRVDHANLDLLVDVGHCLITQENTGEVLARARSRLGYVHFDDNDGAGDLHWPLLTGRLTIESLRSILATLADVGYQGPIALELNPQNANPAAALREGKALLEKISAP